MYRNACTVISQCSPIQSWKLTRQQRLCDHFTSHQAFGIQQYLPQERGYAYMN